MICSSGEKDIVDLAVRSEARSVENTGGRNLSDRQIHSLRPNEDLITLPT